MRVCALGEGDLIKAGLYSMSTNASICSTKQASKMKKKTTSLRRRQNQKAEIDELASHFQLSTPTAAAEQSGTSDNKTSAIDKLSVLRLTTAFLKFQNFLKDSESTLQSMCSFNLRILIRCVRDNNLVIINLSNHTELIL